MSRRSLVEKHDVGNGLHHVAASANATGNWVGIGAASTPAAQTAPSTTVVAALLIVPKWSGVFRVSVHVPWSDSTTADLVTLAIVSAQAATGALAGGTARAVFGQNADAACQGMNLEADAAGGAGITFNGAPIAQLSQWAIQTPTLTGFLTAQASGGGAVFPFSGLIRATANSTKTPFTKLNHVAVGLQVSSRDARVITFGQLNFSIEEIPLS
jgi:hypothetical protein